MSHGDGLNAGLAPEGVLYQKLGDLCVVFNGYAFNSKHFNTESVGLPLIRIRDVNTGISGTYYSGEYDKRFVVNNGDILIGMDGDFRAIYWSAGTALLNQRVCRLQDFDESVEPKFMFYYVQQELDRIHSGIQASTVKHLSSGDLSVSRIPVPPLEVQRQIVRILDQLTQLKTELETELEAELKARRQQYGHYKQQTLFHLGKGGARKVALRDVGTWYGGGTPSKTRTDYWKLGTIPWISPKDMGRTLVDSTMDYITEAAVAASTTRLVPAKAVALVVRSSILDHTLPIAFVPVPAALNQDMKAVIAGANILPKYLFHALHAERGNLLRTVRRNGGSVASLESRKLWEFEIPVPDITEQERLVTLFDKFDALVNDLSIGLPAELAARRMQYDYYRDQLLSFEEAPA